MKIDKKDIVGVTWFGCLIFILTFLIISRFTKVNDSSVVYESSLNNLETEYLQSFDKYTTVNDSVLDQETIRAEWLEKLIILDTSLVELNAEKNKLDSDIDYQNTLTNELEQELTLLETNEFNPYEVNFSLNSGTNIQLIRHLSELKDLGITSVADFTSSDPLTSITLDVVLKREKKFYERSLTPNYAAIEGFVNNHKNDLFMDGNVILQITREDLIPLLYRTITLDDLDEKFVDDIVF